MDHRIPLKMHTVLAFEGMPCHVEDLVGQGSNSIVYKGWYPDRLDPQLRHHVLIKELFPFHPQQKIYRAENGSIVMEPEAQALWDIHQESFEVGNRVHLRLLYDQPELMVMGANLNSFSLNGTLYSVLGYSGGRSLQTELDKPQASLRQIARRMTGLLDALEAFHKSGYLHLDISPDNIMLVGQEEREQLFLIDYNSAREIGNQDSSYLSRKAGYCAPEIINGELDAVGFSSDLFSVAAVFYRCLTGRALELEDLLQANAPDIQSSPLLSSVPQTVRAQVKTLLKKGLHTVPRRRYQSIGQMRLAFQELIDRIDCVGITHWSLWENGKRSVEELIRVNPSLRHLTQAEKMYPIRLDAGESMTLERYLEELNGPGGTSGLLLAQGGMGKTTLLLHAARLLGKRYSPMAPAVFYISLNGWSKGDPRYIRTQILMRLRFKQEENTFSGALHALQQLLEQPIRTKNGPVPTVLLLLDGLNEIQDDPSALIREIHELDALAGVRILAASRRQIPELALKAASLMPLRTEDVSQALGSRGLLVPESNEMLQLLRTPLILSIYLQAGDGGRQLDIRTEEELMGAYMSALLEKELRQLPEDSPQRWQTEAALYFVLPAVALEIQKRRRPLTQEQLLRVVSRCWKTLGSRAFRKAYPAWIGHSGDIRGQVSDPEGWYGIVIHDLLWQRLGMLLKDSAGRYHIFHQTVAEYLSTCRVPTAHRTRWAVIAGTLALCAVLTVGYIHQTNQQAVALELREVMELGASGYVEFGRLYQPLRELTDLVLREDSTGFRSGYNRVLLTLQEEAKTTASEEVESRRIRESSQYDQLALIWTDTDTRYEYTFLSQLNQYPDERAAAYVQALPLLKAWMESQTLQTKVPDFPRALSDLLEADADVAAELYHRAVGIHLTGTETAWINSINKLIAMCPELDSHRDTTVHEDRGQLLTSRNTAYLNASGEFGSLCAKVNAYLRNQGEGS